VSTEGLQVRNLSKIFPGTIALAGVDLDVPAGEIHGLCGGNGSGKSTLIKILAGVDQAEPGSSVRLAGSPEIDPARITPEESHALGIRVVHQDLGLFPDLTVAENIAFGAGFPLGPGSRIRWRELRRHSSELLERFEIKARADTIMRSLPRVAQTEVAIARALQDRTEDGGGLLILDEPTAALPQHEVESLKAVVRRHAERGQSILFVSHRLDEVLDLCDRVTVLRDGRRVADHATAELDEQGLFEAIVSRGFSVSDRKASTTVSHGDVALQLEDIWAGPLKGVDLSLRQGEILGIAGLIGSGRTELLRVIFGDMKKAGGTIRVDGEEVDFRHPDAAIRAGVAFVPETREEAIFPDFTVSMNLAAASLPGYWRGLRMRNSRMRSDSEALKSEFGVKTTSVETPITNLSGGNQQKVVLGRWLRQNPRLLLLDEPTHGVDAGARADIYELIHKAVDEGAAALVVASDFEELIAVVDRAVVLRDGRIVAELVGEALDADRLTALNYKDEEGS
jgi:ribose transport system ATP-binding protein